METQNNTGLGLIKKTIERVEAKENGALFTSVLKKIVNATTEQLRAHLALVAEKVKHFFLPEVVSEGKTGEDFITCLKEKGFRVGDYAMQIMRKKEFIPTTGVKYKPVVIFGKEIENDSERTTENIRKIAQERGYLKPNAELAPMLREKVSDKEMEEMGVYALVVMSDNIKDSGGAPRLLGLHRRGDGRWLRAYYGRPGDEWSREIGFVFLASQV